MIYVTSHHSRPHQLTVSELEKQGSEVKVFMDMTNFNKLKRRHIATKYRGLVENYLKIFSEPWEDSEQWRIIMHDDLFPISQIEKKIRHVLQFIPSDERRLAFFYNPTNKAYKEADELGHCVLKTRYQFWVQCMAVHRDFAPVFVAWARTHANPLGLLSEDRLMAAYAAIHDTPYYVFLPSFVQHEGFEQSTFNIPGKIGKHERRAFNFDPLFDHYEPDWKAHIANPYIENSRISTSVGLKDVS